MVILAQDAKKGLRAAQQRNFTERSVIAIGLRGKQRTLAAEPTCRV